MPNIIDTLDFGDGVERKLMGGPGFVGTREQWDALSPTEQAQFTVRYIIGEFNGIPVDSALSTTSTNPVQNKKITEELNKKAELDANGKVLSSQLPSYVDDVIEYPSLADFPLSGESGKIYVAVDTNTTYRWSGSEYVAIGSSLALGETASTAYRGDRGKTAYDHANDSNKVSTASTSGFYKVGVTAEGHISGTTPVAQSDITNLGIPGPRFVGTTAEWNALTTEQQNAYDERVLTDDTVDSVEIDPVPTSGSTNAVMSDGVYQALTARFDGTAIKLPSGIYSFVGTKIVC